MTQMPDGTQFAEVSCDTDSTLYQIVSTQASTAYEWGVSHHGRTANAADTLLLTMFNADELQLAVNQDFTLLRNWMLQNDEFEAPLNTLVNQYTVYTTADLSEFSLIKDDVRTIKLEVWLISSNAQAWYNYGTNSTYYRDINVPTMNGQAAGVEVIRDYLAEYTTGENETSTCISFTTFVTRTVKDGVMNYASGNVIDNIHLELKDERTVTETPSQIVNTRNSVQYIGELKPVAETQENSVYEWGITISGNTESTETIMMVMCDEAKEETLCSEENIAALKTWLADIGTAVPYKGKVSGGFTDTDGDGYGDDYQIYTDGEGHFSLVRDEAHPDKIAVWLLTVDGNVYNFGTNSAAYTTDPDHFYMDYNTFYYTEAGETSTVMNLYGYSETDSGELLNVQIALEGVALPVDIDGAIDATNANVMYQDTDENGNLLPSDTVLRNGSFEYITFEYAREIYSNPANRNLFRVLTERYFHIKQSVIAYWETTAFDDYIEYFNINSTSINNEQKSNHYYINPYMKEGVNAAELNANEESSLYQVINTPSDSIYKWGLSHRGRNTGTDTMALVIGPNQTNKPTKPSKDERDQFAQMVDWVRSDEIAAQIEALQNLPDTTNYCSEKIVVYSRPFGANGTFLNNEDGQPFSLTESSDYSEKWIIYIIRSDNTGWHDYGDNLNDNSFDSVNSTSYTNTSDFWYTVPTDSEQTLFAFVAVEVDAMKDGTMDLTYGNLLDDIRFTVYMPQKLTTTTGGKGAQILLNDDGSEDRTTAVVATNIPETYNGTEYGGQTETLALYKTKYRVEAYEDISDGRISNTTGGTFLGAYVVSGRGSKKTTFFVPASSFTKTENAADINPDGTENTGNTVTKYTCDFIATAPTKVHLIFVSSPAVTYDENGGIKYECITADDEDGIFDAGIYQFNDHPTAFDPSSVGTIHSTEDYTSHAAQGQNDNWMFTGWLVASTAGNEHVVLPSQHTASYTFSQDVSGAAYDDDDQTDYIQHSRKITFYTTPDYTDTLYVKASQNVDENGLYGTEEPGEVLVAQWRWRQNFGAKLEVTDDSGNVSYVTSTVGGYINAVSGTYQDETNPVTDNYFDTFTVNGEQNGLSYFAEGGESVSGACVARDNYTFIGWQDEEGNFVSYKTILSFSVEERTSKTWYAVFRPNRDTQTTSVTVTKIWSDNNNQDGRRANYGVTLYADGVAVGSEVVLTSVQTVYSWVNLPVYSGDNAIVYTVRETTIPTGYTATQEGLVITNSHTPEKRDITATKKWDDDNDHDGLRDSYGITLYADGNPVGAEVILTADNLTYTWTDLDAYADGKLISYTVKETTVPEGYASTVSGFTIMNTHRPETGGVNSDAVVIDYGIPVDIHVTENDTPVSTGASVVTAVFTTLPENVKLNTGRYSSSQLAGVTTSLNTAHAQVTLTDNVIRYALTDTNISSEEVIYYEYMTANRYYYYTSVTVIPATTIYYEDNFLTYTDGVDKSTGLPIEWEEVGDTSLLAQALQSEDRPGFSSSAYDADNGYGYDPVYDTSSMATYSMGSSKVVTLRAGSFDKYHEATASFTFTGTGFDIISVTGGNTGTCIINVVNSDGKTVEKKIVNTYYGYSYGRLYADENGGCTFAAEGNSVLYESGETGKVSLKPYYRAVDGTATDTVMYYATGSTETHPIYSSDVYYYDGNNGYTLTPMYYSDDGSVTDTVTDSPAYAYAYAYAYGWLANTSSASSLYQIPILKMSGLDYGTYTVTVAPRYAAMYDTNKLGSYSVYIDAVRVYNPCGDETTMSSVVSEAYIADKEANVHYYRLKQNILDASDLFGNDVEDTDNAMFIDGFSALSRINGTSAESLMKIYREAGPNNELYLAQGQTIAFNVKIVSATRLSGIQLGSKLTGETPDNENGSLIITSSSDARLSREIIISGSTELYRDITSCIQWRISYNRNTQQFTYTSVNPVCILNNSSALISLTDIKWTTADDKTVDEENMLIEEEMVLSSNAGVMNYAAEMLSCYVFVEPDSPDVTAVSVRWQGSDITEGDEAILEIRTPSSVTGVTIGGVEPTDSVINEDGSRTWFISMVVGKPEYSSYPITISDVYGRQIELIVDVPQSDSEEDTTNYGLPTVLIYLKGIILMIVKLIETVLPFSNQSR